MTASFKIGQPRFLSKEEVLTLHRASLDAYGGADGFVNEGALDSAIAQARQGFGGDYVHEFPFGMAAAYGFHIAMNHAFRDGNKRTAFAAMVAFLHMNGWNFDIPDSHAANFILVMIERPLDKKDVAAKLEATSLARPSFELRDFFSIVNVARLHDFLVAFTAEMRPQELDQSAREAATHIPAVHELFAASHSHFAAGDAAAGANLGNQATLLIALFRIAEDMGYEW